MTEPDVIVDILQRVKAKTGASDAAMQDIERDARQYWGGERCYVAKAGESPRRREAAERADRIRADHKRGEHVPLLARRYELTERRVRQILGLAEKPAAANDDTRRRPLPEHASRHRKRKPNPQA